MIIQVVKRLLQAAIILLLIAVLPGIPPHVEFESYSVAPSLPLEGVLVLNTKLNGAERLFDGEIHGPEALRVHGGALYTTLHGGYVARLAPDGGLRPVVKFGRDCDGFHEEHICGRPLGFEFDKNGQMYVADAYYGLFKVDPSTGKYEGLVSINDTIDGSKPMIPNSVAVGDDGSVYWTDSSTSHQLHDGVFLILANGNGRLIKYDPVKKTNAVLMDKLHFSNGVALSLDGSFLVVSETMMYRLIKYHLKGPKAGRSEVFIEGLPGMPDNLAADSRGGFTLTLIHPRDPGADSPISLLAPYPVVRRLAARLLHQAQKIFVIADWFYPMEVFKRLAHWIGHFEMLPDLPPKRGTVLFLSSDGKITRSLYSTDGLAKISDFVEFEGHYYLGSPFNNFLARVKAT